MRIKDLLFLFLGLLMSCSDAPTLETRDTTEHTVPIPKPNALPETSHFFVGVDNLRLRAEPGQQGAEVVRLPFLTKVVPTGNTSKETSLLTLRGFYFKEHWLEVETGQLKGWVFAGALDFDPGSSQQNQAMFQQRLSFFLSAPIDFTKNNEQIAAIRTSDDLLAAFEATQALQQRLNPIFEKKVKLDAAVPSTIWLDKGLSGLRSRITLENRRLQLYQDYSAWIQLAAQTSNGADDSFFQFLKKVDGKDGLEFEVGNYAKQSLDLLGISRLGEGIHIALLKEAEQLFADRTLFSPLIKTYVDRILKDMLEPTMTYWNPLGPINAELNEIILGSWTVITTTQLDALKERQRAFVEYKLNNIRLDEKAVQ